MYVHSNKKKDARREKLGAVVGLLLLLVFAAGIVAVKACVYDWNWKCVIAECRKEIP